MNICDGGTGNKQESGIEEKGIFEEAKNKVAPLVNLIGLLYVLDQRNETALEAAFVGGKHVVGGHDAIDSCEHAFVAILLKLIADDSVQEGGGDGFYPGLVRKKLRSRCWF